MNTYKGQALSNTDEWHETLRIYGKRAGWTLAGTGTLAALFLTFAGWDYVAPNQRAIRVRYNRIVEMEAQPGFRWKTPMFEGYYKYNAPDNVARNDVSIISKDNTADRNTLSAELRIHHQVDVHQGKPEMWYTELGSNNGLPAIKTFAEQSFNAVAARYNLREGGMPKAEEIGKAFLEDLERRLLKNQFPAAIVGVELTKLNAALSVPTQVRLLWTEDGNSSTPRVLKPASPAPAGAQ